MANAAFQSQYERLSYFLRSTGCYSNPHRVERDAVDVLRSYPSLVVQNQQQNLIALMGTLPVTYRGNQYNIPVHIWFTSHYPARHPLCYIVPTNAMVIKERHPHCDTSGMVYHPYISTWKETSSLVALVRHMVEVFSHDPPVRAQSAKPQAAPERTTHSSPALAGGYTQPPAQMGRAAPAGDYSSLLAQGRASSQPLLQRPPSTPPPAYGHAQQAIHGTQSHRGPQPHQPSFASVPSAGSLSRASAQQQYPAQQPPPYTATASYQSKEKRQVLASKIQARLDDIRRNIDRAADGTEVDPGGVHQTRAALLSSQAHEATKELDLHTTHTPQAMLENTLMDLEVEMREMSAWFESRQGAKEFNIDDDTKPSDALSMQYVHSVGL